MNFHFQFAGPVALQSDINAPIQFEVTTSFDGIDFGKISATCSVGLENFILEAKTPPPLLIAARFDTLTSF